ncbi:peptidylprolyl isomerase [Nocardioides soli]|uniref:Peptidyl-prolyl cis-trans isomerase n=1 Tax=Nocardioides soli TaxID=1036020 RepID=A0A7W4Z3H1_9ACTN|nr:peptidylprolyl isomerase [Nocardioides soli]MBB3045063.1 peptidyl-prolyl cis-trans isomerase B (cyclophilin B) [Nocardioides soli]
MRSRLTVVPATLLALAALAGCSGSDDTDTAADTAPTEATSCDYPSSSTGAAKDVDPPPASTTTTGTVPVTITTSIGDLTADLDADATPCTVSSFVSLAEQGYFDGTSCHRLVTPPASIAVLQCGDPTGTGTGGPGYSFADELSGSETYGTGTLAMANAGPDTNGSQFFVVYADSSLPPSYTVFGQLDEESVQLVAKAARKGSDNANGPSDGHPTTPVDIESVTVG